MCSAFHSSWWTNFSNGDFNPQLFHEMAGGISTLGPQNSIATFWSWSIISPQPRGRSGRWRLAQPWWDSRSILPGADTTRHGLWAVHQLHSSAADRSDRALWCIVQFNSTWQLKEDRSGQRRPFRLLHSQREVATGPAWVLDLHLLTLPGTVSMQGSRTSGSGEHIFVLEKG